MEEKDYIKDLFQEQLSKHEVPVRPDLWSSVSSSIGASSTAAAAATGMSLLAKITIGVAVAASVTGVSIWYANDKTPTPKKENKQEQVSNETFTSSNTTGKKTNSSVSNSENKTSENNTVSTPSIFQEIDSYEYSSKIMNSEPVSTSAIASKNEEPVAEVKSNSEAKSTKAEDRKETTTTIKEIVPEASSLQFNMPNVFTPNGDGNNDLLVMNVENVSDFVVIVLDANSKVVFKSEDPNFSWDGRNTNGDMLPAGNYIYYVTAKDNAGKPVTKYSQLTIRY